MSSCCDKWCEGCEYLSKGGEVWCDYFTKTGTRRGCPAGTGCDKRLRPEKVSRDARLKSQEQMQKAQLAAQEKKKAMPPTRQRNEYGGRPRELRGASLDPVYLRRMEEQRRQRLMPILVPLQRDAIRGWRQRLGLSQAEAGALLGVSGSLVSNWERGTVAAKWDLLEAHGCKRPTGERRKAWETL